MLVCSSIEQLSVINCHISLVAFYSCLMAFLPCVQLGGVPFERLFVFNATFPADECPVSSVPRFTEFCSSLVGLLLTHSSLSLVLLLPFCFLLCIQSASAHSYFSVSLPREEVATSICPDFGGSFYRIRRYWREIQMSSIRVCLTCISTPLSPLVVVLYCH
jgi:hypothetical protein